MANELSASAPFGGGHRQRRSWIFLQRLWRGLGVAQYELIGVIQLGQHVLKRVEALPPPAHDPDLYKNWVASEFTYPLRDLLWGSARDRRTHTVLSMVVVVGGFATSGIAAAASHSGRGHTTSWIIFGIGLVLALVGGLNQIFRPSFRANERTSIAVEMREEGWSFALSTGDYAPLTADSQAAFAKFQARVAEFQRRIAAIRVLASEQSATRRAGKRGQ